MKSFTCGLAAAMMFWMSVAHAQPVPPVPPLQPGEQPIGEAIAPMKKGQVAPFSGLLLSPEAVAKTIVELSSRDEQIAIEVNKARAQQLVIDQLQIDELNADIAHQKAVAAAERESLNKQLKAVNEQLSKAEKSKNDLPLFIGLGAIGGALIAILSVMGVSAVH